MNVWSVPRGVIIIVGIVGLILGVLIGIIQIRQMFSLEYYAYSPYPNTLSGATQEASILITNIWLAISGVMGGLLLMIPVGMGRLSRVTGYTTPNAEVVPKAYRAGGIYMIIGGAVSLIARIFFSKGEMSLVVIVPIAMLIIGIVALLAGMAKKT